MLTHEDFIAVRQKTVLVALDLLIMNENGEMLVGRRRNPPAKGFLFVPGGRVQKSETLEEALKRISAAEIGLELNREQAILQGVYDHIYDPEGDELPDPVHYVVLACRFTMSAHADFVHDTQHDRLFFMSPEEIESSPDVHPFTKNYFLNSPENLFLSPGRSGD